MKVNPTGYRTALLHQGAPVPAVKGISKPMKPGGYADGSADIAFALKRAGETIVTPVSNPEPTADLEWSFPDTVSGIREAIGQGANVLWANTVLHSKHAIVTLRDELAARDVRVFGPSPLSAEKYDDKEWTNRWLSTQEGLIGYFPKALLYGTSGSTSSLDAEVDDFPLPAVVKPIRGRGSHGVVRVSSKEEMRAAIEASLKESDAVLIEQYLSGEEITITVMPPGTFSVVGKKTEHWALPVITRFDQINGVAPWNGTVPVTANSRVVTSAEAASDLSYAAAQQRCEIVARLVQATAPIRIDCRRDVEGGAFFLFDVNLKPNAGGAGRPGRETQAALTTMSAAEIGWDWSEFAVNLLRTARPVKELLAE
ncbi:hypothetical protein I317_07072 [Kwoniella heveanensis CBS 569]|uniref:ATP-grasp domain-containing protein n=1 Tax=Kwoniella heveanensis BCC8398 TaxID=1296120 RepID=A0A1B9GSA1_9TREE|nr:hypothetical protein I316_04296 [Kwoniella heveanensis BCC8398]OCF39131.1 hypothetical protein I317_07072 [Kwoniella heveanensis CBS 569]